MAEFKSDVKYARTLKRAIAKSITSPPINESNIQNLTVSSGARRKLHSVHLQTSSLVAEYTISTESTYPSEAFATQLTKAVSNGDFTAELQESAEQIMGASTPLTSATTTALVLGKYPEKLFQTISVYYFQFQLTHV